MAEGEDSTDLPADMDEALAALGISDPEAAAEVAYEVAAALATYTDAPPRVRPHAVLRRLENIARALRERRPPTRRALASPGVAAALSHAGVEVLTRIGRARQKGARAKPMELIERDSYDQGLHFVDEAIRRVRAFEAERRGQRGVRLGRIADTAKTDAVCRLAKLFRIYKGQQPTCRGKGPLTAFERFLEATFARRGRSNGRALALRWRRHAAARSGRQNGVQRSSAAA